VLPGDTIARGVKRKEYDNLFMHSSSKQYN
jgi:hypothetical protein